MARRRRAARHALAGAGAPAPPPPRAMAVCLRPTAPAALAPAAVARQIDVQVGGSHHVTGPACLYSRSSAPAQALSSPYLARK